MSILSEKDYEARYDAQTLIEAKTIENDKQRLSRAKKAVNEIKQEKIEELKNINKIGKLSSVKSTNRSSSININNRLNKPYKLSR